MLCAKMSHLTRTMSEPCCMTRGIASVLRKRPFSAFELVSAKEVSRESGAGFSAADRAYLGRQHFPSEMPVGLGPCDE